MPITREQAEGGEFDWFAVDADGYLALCCTAGYGEMPSAVLQQCSESEDDWPIHYIEQLVEELAEIGTYQPEGRGPGTCEEWKLLGARGLYVYDWRHWHGPYERIIVPTVAIRFDAIPSGLVQAMRVVALDQVLFSDRPSFQGSRD